MNKKLQLAPMQAMTDVTFMNTYHKVFGGFDQMMAPYLLASSKSPLKIQRLNNIFGDINPDIDLIPQLLSNEPEGFLHYSNLFADFGFTEVNWNLGCPNTFVAKKKRGSGLLPYPEDIRSVLEGIMPHMPIKLSIKIRLGYYSSDEILPIIDILNNYDLEEVIIHGRTAIQMYSGYSDVDTFAQIYQKFKAPVIYNGDILTKGKILELEEKCPHTAGYMIGRGAFINPFITNQIKGIDLSDSVKREKYKELYYTLYEFYNTKTMNDRFLLHRMKELWQSFAQSFVNSERVFSELRVINDVAKMEVEVENIFDNEEFNY